MFRGRSAAANMASWRFEESIGGSRGGSFERALLASALSRTIEVGRKMVQFLSLHARNNARAGDTYLDHMTEMNRLLYKMRSIESAGNLQLVN